LGTGQNEKNWNPKTTWEGLPEKEFTWEIMKIKIQEVPKLVKDNIEKSLEVGHPLATKADFSYVNRC
jgi:hypothetical protein